MADFSIDDVMSGIDRLAPVYGIDSKTAKSLIVAENTSDGRIRGKSFSGDATNSNRTMGIGQVIPSTARGLQQAGLLPPTWTFDPDDLDSQLSASLAAMKDMKSRLNDPNDPLELGAYYNGGTKSLKAYQAGESLNPETTKYLQKQRTFMADTMTPQQIERAAASGTSTTPKGTTSSSSNRTTTRSTIYDENAMRDYENSFDTSQLAFGSAAKQVAATAANRPGMVMDTMQAILDAGTAAGEAASSKAAVETAAAIRRQSILDQANLNPTATNNRAQIALDALDSTSAQVDARRGALDEMMSASLLEDPLRWLSAQIQLPGAVGEYNNIVRLQQDNLGRYNAAKDIAGSQINLSQGTEADEIAKAGVAAANAASSEAVARAKMLQQQVQGKNVSDALSLAALARQGTGEALQRVALTKQQIAESEGISEREAAKRLQDQNMADINRVLKAAGSQRELDPARYKSLPAKGRELLDQAASRGTFGSDFTEALEFLDNFGSLQNMATGGNLSTARWVQKTREAASLKTQTAQAEWESPKNPNRMKPFDLGKNMREQLGATASSYMGQAAVNMRGAPDANPYRVDYESISREPALANNVLAQLIKTHGPKGTEPLYDNYDELTFVKRINKNIDLAADPALAVKKSAADIATFYKLGAQKAVTNTNYPMFGMSKPEKTYALKLDEISTGAKPLGTIDFGDPVQVERFLMLSYAQRVAASAQWSVMGSIDPKDVMKTTFPQQ